jgi:hypothetical protein
MEMMRAHKQDVEERLKYECPEGVKKPRARSMTRRKGSLAPNWYTENIYSNQSIDNSDTEHRFAPIHPVRETSYRKDINGNKFKCGAGADDDDIFTLEPKPNYRYFQRKNNYPKSSSCCFGTGYEQSQSKIPKSHSFSTSRSRCLFNHAEQDTNGDYSHKYRGAEFYRKPRHNRDFAFMEEPTKDDYLSTRICDRKGCINETCFTKKYHNNLDRHHREMNNNNHENYIIKEWDARNRNCIRDRNGNFKNKSFLEDLDLLDARSIDGDIDDDVRTTFDDDYLMGFDDDETICEEEDTAAFGLPRLRRRPLGYDNELDQLFQEERSKMILRDKFDKLNKYSDDFIDDYKKSYEDIFRVSTTADLAKRNTFYAPKPIKSKTMLEVKPPNKYDDSSSNSTDTDLELDDFNFDFEKYWEELEKSPSPTISDSMEDKSSVYPSSARKIKNINVERYNNEAMFDLNDDPMLYKNNYLEKSRTHPGRSSINYFPKISSILNGSPIMKFNRKVYPNVNTLQKYNNLHPNSAQYAHRSSRPGREHRSASQNALSLLNNIFHIYKPNKYSSLNCQTQKNCLKSTLPAKKMNVSSTARPLGMSDGRRSPQPRQSSMKRPLMIHPHSGDIEQARFQIIPDKTGLKISPLYHFDSLDDSSGSSDIKVSKAKFKLKSTSRPLSFW